MSKDWAIRTDSMEETGLKEGVKLIGGRKEVWCYKQGDLCE